jgi:hypothetical protein
VDRFDWERALLADPNLSPIATYVGLAMATFGNRNGTNIRPGFPTLVAMLRKSDSQVRRGAAELVREGWLVLVKRGGKDRDANPTANEYRLGDRHLRSPMTEDTSGHPRPEVSTPPVISTDTSGHFEGTPPVTHDRPPRRTTKKNDHSASFGSRRDGFAADADAHTITTLGDEEHLQPHNHDNLTDGDEANGCGGVEAHRRDDDLADGEYCGVCGTYNPGPETPIRGGFMALGDVPLPVWRVPA